MVAITKIISLIFAVSVLTGCVGNKPSRDNRVLFVGNSLTYYNDLPSMVLALDRALEADQALSVEMLASAGRSIAEHLKDGYLERALSQSSFDVVILQDIGGWPLCPTTIHERCEGSVAAIQEAVRLVRSVGARPIWYSTWQPFSSEAQRALSETVQQVALNVQVDVADVGAALIIYSGTNNGETLLLQDGHPDVLGSWVAAATT